MRLNAFEYRMVNNSVRAWIQRTQETPRLIGPAGTLAGQNVLEVGCGRGIGIEILLGLSAAQVTGFDLDPKAVAAAQRQVARFGARARVSVGDAEHMPAEDATFDAVVEYNVLHHIPGWRDALREIARVLRPGGTFYLEDFLEGMTSPWWSRLLSGDRNPVVFTGLELRTAIEEAGLQVTHWQQWREVVLQGRAVKPGPRAARGSA